MARTERTGIAAGRKGKRGHKAKLRSATSRPAYRKGTRSKTTDLTRDVIRSVCGFAPYERRVMDLLVGGGVNAEKRARKFAKKRLGTLRRAQKKVAELTSIMEKQGA
eukprot:188698_1